MSQDQLVKILNYQYRDTPADLISAKPTGLIQGYQLNYDSNNQSWNVVAVGGNYITIQNGSTGTYANPASEGDGANVVGGPNPYQWQQLSVPGGWYQIATNDGRYAWYLTGSANYSPIILTALPNTDEAAQWGYQPTPYVK